MNRYHDQWEHKRTVSNLSCANHHMDEMGKDRWELVQVIPRGQLATHDDWSELTMFWKRIVQPRDITDPQGVYDEIVASIEGNPVRPQQRTSTT